MRLSVCLFGFLLLLPATVFAQDDVPVEIVVTGKQPGPPMWRVKNGDHTLWIFAHLSPIPKNIVWESKRVEEVIAQAQEYITAPDASVRASPLLMLNPINIVRGISLGKRLVRNEDKAMLEEVLPPDLYRRFSALKEQYFPDNKKIEKVRPLVAGGQMVSLIQDEADLVPANDVRKKIKRLVKRNRDLKVTEIKYEMKLEGGFRAIADRVENMMDSLSWELELSCFERQLSLMEDGVDEMQYRASAWAQGYIEEFKFIPLPGDPDDACTNLIASSSEQATFEDIVSELSTRWLAAAENALQTNETTFSVLDINMLLMEDGLMARLAERGYEVIEP